MIQRTSLMLIGLHWFGCCISTISLASAASYQLTDLGVLVELPGRDESHPNAVGPDGSVVGSNAPQGAYQAWLFDGAWTDLGTLGGGESFASDINSQGTVVGYSHTTSLAVRGFIWSEGATDGVPENPEMKPLGTFGGEVSQAYSINDGGEATGYAETTKRAHAFVTEDGVMVDIGESIGGLPNSFGYGINNLGHVAGAAYNAGYSAPHAFLYDGYSATLIGDLSGGDSFALDLNDSDHVVGYSSVSSVEVHGFHFSDGLMQDIGTLAGDYSYALSINNANEIVGLSSIDTANDVFHAFIYRDGVMQDLNSLLDASAEGWELIEARSINDRGQITGVGLVDGNKHGFLLTSVNEGPGPTITGAAIEGNDVLVTFTSVRGETYNLEATNDLTISEWTTAVSDLLGTGSEITARQVGGASEVTQFYQVLRVSL